jgi:hypothetical protein
MNCKSFANSESSSKPRSEALRTLRIALQVNSAKGTKQHGVEEAMKRAGEILERVARHQSR